MKNRSNLFLGILLIAVGAWLAATKQVPSLQAFTENMTGAMWTIAAGVLILVIGLLTGAPGMAGSPPLCPGARGSPFSARARASSARARWGPAGGGVWFLLTGFPPGAPGWPFPASIVAGIGGILFYQDRVGDYSSWSYMWTLIPGFVGVGSILAGVLGENTRRNISNGLRTIGFSAVLFLVFGTFLGNLDFLGEYGVAILLILLGLFILARGFWRGGGHHETG